MHIDFSEHPGNVALMETTTDTMRPGKAAAALGVTTQTLARWATAGRLKYRTLPGGMRLYTRASVLALAAELAGTSQDTPTTHDDTED